MTWQLQEAKNRLSEVVDRALTSGAQTITKHGKPVAVVLSVDEYAQLKPESQPDWYEWLRSCPSPGLSDLIEERPHERVRDVSFGFDGR